MWLFTTFGFFSVVKKHGDTDLTVRARVAADLDNLRTRVPELSETIATPDQDYPYRATVSAVNLAIGLGEAIQEIDYDNFKAEGPIGPTLARRQGYFRAGMYSQVWMGLHNLPYEAGNPSTLLASPGHFVWTGPDVK
jgi:hypothetical protein